MKDGIWSFDHVFSLDIPEKQRITLGECNNTVLGFRHNDHKRLFVLREDENPSGSHKDRYMAYTLSYLQKDNSSGYVISTSGNAGISLARYSQHIGKPSIICLKPDSSDEIIERILYYKGHPVLTDKPINFAKIINRTLGYLDIRAGLNPLSDEGYRSISAEIFQKGCPVDSIFVFSTSFSTALGILEGYKYLNKLFGVQIPRVFAVLSGDFHPFPDIISITRINDFLNKIVCKDNIRFTAIGCNSETLWNDKIRIGGFCKPERFKEACSKLSEFNGELIYVNRMDNPEIRSFFDYYSINTSYQSTCALYSAYLLQKLRIVYAPIVIQSGFPSSAASSGRYSKYIINSLKDLMSYMDKMR